ncbi:MAG: C40 family peptidase [Thermoleophilaceae bacterium]|nr:C40 family peptidase [Thermoleophilaceae bacterium]
MRGRSAIGALAVVALLVAGCGREQQSSTGESDIAKKSDDVVLTPGSVDPAAVRQAEARAGRSKARVVQLQGAGAKKTYDSGEGVSPGAPTDAEVKGELKEARSELRKFKRYLGTTAYLQTGPKARVLKDGTAVAPDNAPEPVKRVIQAANAIAKLPYKWGGGHGAWRDNGYDCSGSVSFALAGAGLLKSPLASGGFMNWGDPGPGKWITIYANEGHMFMMVAGLRFDTSGRGRAGTRWQSGIRSAAGLEVRRAPGL